MLDAGSTAIVRARVSRPGNSSLEAAAPTGSPGLLQVARPAWAGPATRAESERRMVATRRQARVTGRW